MMTAIASSTPSPITLETADAARFARVRSEILPSRRRELSQREFARDEYQGYRALGDEVPFLCRRDWIAARPMLMPLPSEAKGEGPPVVTEYDPSLHAQNKPEWTHDVLGSAQRMLPRLAGSSERVSTFTEAVTLTHSAPAGSLFNGTCYRLLTLQPASFGRIKLSFGVCGYFDYLNTTEVLAQEAAMGDRRDVRAAAGHWLADLHRRHAGSGICALTVIRKRNEEMEILLMDRSQSQVQTGLGLVHVRPAGEFQPVSDDPARFSEECDLWYILLRESLEEIGGVSLSRHFSDLREFLSHDSVARIIEAVRDGAWRTYYLGFGFDPLNYKPEFLLCSVIDARAFQELFPGFRRDSSEGQAVGRGAFGVRFAPSKAGKLLTHPRIHPAAAACLSLARKHSDFLRSG
jgi:hypothetical protein